MAVRIEQYTPEEIDDMSLVEIAHEVLAQANEPFYYRDLMRKVAEICHLTDEEVDDRIARLYTDINIDGRFLCIGDNVWGLRRWYPTEKTTDRAAGKKFLRKELPEFDDDDDLLDPEEELLDEEPPFAFGDEEESFEEEVVLEEEVEFVEEEVDDADELALDDDDDEDDEI